MKKSVTLLLVGLFILSSCSSVTFVNREKINPNYAGQINYLGRTKGGKVLLENGRVFRAKKISVNNDSIRFVEVVAGKEEQYAAKEVKAISFKSRVTGFAYGTVVGFFSGILAGYMYLRGDTSGDMSGLFVAFSAAAGSAVGGLIGMLRGVDIKYVFTDKKERGNSKIGRSK